MSEGEETPAVPAATVVLVRDGAEGLETLLLKKNSKLAYGGMWVFPGGRIDPQDWDGADGVVAAARRAAVREAAEEADLRIDPGRLVLFSRWTPPPQSPKRFDTWFFVAPAPAGEVTIDDGEIHDHRWARPAEALARRDAGEVEVVPPTFVSLDRLASYADVADALADSAAREVEHFQTRMGRLGDALVTMWDGDAGYVDGDPTRPGPRHRLVMGPQDWVYDRSDRGA